MAIRFDDWVDFHNPTNQVFIGRWEKEDYAVEPGGTLRLPAWLARHFAKRLCDTYMIKTEGEPLRDDDAKRVAFIKRCLGDVATMGTSTKVLTTKQQIEEQRHSAGETIEERRARLRRELAALDATAAEQSEYQKPKRKDEGASIALLPDNSEVQVADPEVADEPEPAPGPVQMPDELPADDVDNSNDEPLSPQAREQQIGKQLAAEAEATAKAVKAGAVRAQKNTVGSKTEAEDDFEPAAFEGNDRDADGNVHAKLDEALAKDMQGE